MLSWHLIVIPLPSNARPPPQEFEVVEEALRQLFTKLAELKGTRVYNLVKPQVFACASLLMFMHGHGPLCGPMDRALGEATCHS